MCAFASPAPTRGGRKMLVVMVVNQTQTKEMHIGNSYWGFSLVVMMMMN